MERLLFFTRPKIVSVNDCKDYLRVKDWRSSPEACGSRNVTEALMPFLSGRGFEDLMVVNLARYKPTGEYVTVRRVNLEACTNEMVTFLQVTQIH